MKFVIEESAANALNKKLTQLHVITAINKL